MRPGVFVLIRDRTGRYLMLERADGHGIEFIKGGVEIGESFKDAVVREIEEEIGMKVCQEELIELPLALSFTFPLKEGYEIRIYKGFLIIKNEIDIKMLLLDRFFSSAKLIHLNDISKLISFSEYYEIMKEADKLLKKKFDLILGINKIRHLL